MFANNISFDTRITPDIVRFCVGKLKPHKDDGKYGFKCDNLINGTNKLFAVLSIMFNAMLTHGFNPDDLSYQYAKTVRVPFVQVILIGPFLFLIVYANYMIMFLFIHTTIYYNHVIYNLAFKSNHSTVLCTAIYIETINHYFDEGSNVYSCLIDASKAFDRVHWGRHFNILIERKVYFYVYVNYWIAILDNFLLLHGDFSSLLIFL